MRKTNIILAAAVVSLALLLLIWLAGADSWLAEALFGVYKIPLWFAHMFSPNNVHWGSNSSVIGSLAAVPAVAFFVALIVLVLGMEWRFIQQGIQRLRSIHTAQLDDARPNFAAGRESHLQAYGMALRMVESRRRSNLLTRFFLEPNKNLNLELDDLELGAGVLHKDIFAYPREAGAPPQRVERILARHLVASLVKQEQEALQKAGPGSTATLTGEQIFAEPHAEGAKLEEGAGMAAGGWRHYQALRQAAQTIPSIRGVAAGRSPPARETLRARVGRSALWDWLHV